MTQVFLSTSTQREDRRLFVSLENYINSFRARTSLIKSIKDDMGSELLMELFSHGSLARRLRALCVS